MEGDSEHLIARSIREEAETRALALPDISNFEAIKGHGIQADIDGHKVYVGGPQLLTHLAIDLPKSLVAVNPRGRW